MFIQYNSLMMANYQRVKDLLQKMNCAEYVKYVEQELQILSEDPLFVNLLSLTIRDKNVSHNTKLAAAIMLNKTISQHYQSFDEEMVINLFSENLFDFSVDFKYKKAFQTSFTTVIQLSNQDFIEQLLNKFYTRIFRQAIIQQEHSFASESSNQGITNHNLLKIQVLFFIYQCTLGSNNHLALLASHIYGNIDKLLRKVEVIYSAQNIQILKQMNSLFGSLIDNIDNSDQASCDDYADHFCSNNGLINWIYSQFYLQGTPKQCWISCNSFDDHELLNDLKVSAAYLHRKIITHFSRSTLQGLFISQKHYQCCGVLINTLTTLAAFYTHLSAYETFASVLACNLGLLFKINYKYFLNIYATILHSIVFPLLKIRQEEMILFQNQPEEFNELAEDCCDHQKFDVLKSEISKLLQNICDQNNQASQYVVQHSILSLKVHLALDQNFENQAPNFLPVQTALLSLCILSYKLSNYKAQLLQLQNILKFDSIKGRLSNLQLNRLFTFLAYNYCEVYKNPLEGQAWIILAMASNLHPSVQIAGLELVSNVVQEYFTFEFLINFANRTISKNTKKHYQTFIKMVNFHMTKIGQKDMITVVEIIFNLIGLQIDLYQRRVRAHIMNIGACLQQLRKMIDHQTYCNNKPILKQVIWKVLNFIPQLQKYSLDDEIVSIVVSFINKQQFLTEDIMLTLNHFIKLYQNGREQSITYIVYFNSIVMKNNPQTALLIGQILVQTFIKIQGQARFEAKKIGLRTALGSILIVLQNIVAIYGNDLGVNFIDKVSSLSLLLIPQSDNPQDRIQSVLVARALNLLFLCHMHKKNELALRRLLAFQDSPIFVGYDLRVLCLCFGKQIFRETDIISVTQMINLMVKSISASKQPAVSIKSKKNPLSIKSSSTKIRIRRIEDFQKILKFIKTPFPQDFLPQLQLKKIIQTMKKNNPYLYQSIIKSLNQSIAVKLKDLMSEVFVGGSKRKIIHVGDVKENGKNINGDLAIKGVKKRLLKLSENQQREQQQQQQQSCKKRTLNKKKMKNENIKPSNKSIQ